MPTTSDNNEQLYDKMLRIADRDNLPEDHLMRVRAIELREVEIYAKKLLGAWARARRVYCAYTGEPLI